MYYIVLHMIRKNVGSLLLLKSGVDLYAGLKFAISHQHRWYTSVDDTSSSAKAERLCDACFDSILRMV